MKTQYRLLRDFFVLKAGTLLTKIDDDSQLYYAPNIGADKATLVASFVENNPSFFEEVKDTPALPRCEPSCAYHHCETCVCFDRQQASSTVTVKTITVQPHFPPTPMLKQYKLLKPLPGVPAGTIYSRQSCPDAFFSEDGGSFKLVAVQDVVAHPEWFEEVKSENPYPVPEGTDTYWLDGVSFEASQNTTRNVYGDLNTFLTLEHAKEASAAVKAVIGFLHQKWNDEARGQGANLRSRLRLFEESAIISRMELGQEVYTVSGELATKARELFKTILTKPSA